MPSNNNAAHASSSEQHNNKTPIVKDDDRDKKRLSVQDALNLPAPSDDEVQRQFAAFLDEKLFKPDVRAKMSQLPTAQKWKLLCQERVVQQEAAHSSHRHAQQHTPEEWAELLRQSVTNATKQLTANEYNTFLVTLRSAGKTWLLSFLSANGIEALVLTLREHTHMEYKLQCIKQLMNMEMGLAHILQHDEIIQLIISLLSTSSPAHLIMIFDLLSVLCWLNDEAHNKIVEAITRGPNRNNELDNIFNLLASQQVDLQTHVFTFVNALINAISDLESRINLRNEFGTRLNVAIEAVKSRIDEAKNKNDFPTVSQLSTQYNLYTQLYASDSQEAIRQELDLSDINSVWCYVRDTSMRMGCSSQLLDILHCMMLIEENVENEKIWNHLKFVTHYLTIQEEENDKDKEKAKSDKDQQNDKSPASLTYNQLKQLLDDKDAKYDHTQQSEFQTLTALVEEQRRVIQEWNSKYETLKLENKKQIDDLNQQLEVLKKNAASIPAPTIPSAPAGAAPAAPPLAPALSSSAPSAPPLAPPLAPSAPSAPPMAPSLSAPIPPPPGAPPSAPLAPPLAPPPPIPSAPGAPPLAPPSAPGPPAPPGAPAAPGAPPSAPSAPAPPPPSLPAKPNPKLHVDVPLRPLFWASIPAAQIGNTIFKNLNDATLDKTQMQQIEDEFTTAVKKEPVVEKEKEKSSSASSSTSPRNATPSLVDAKRAYAVTIGLARFKLSFHAIRDAIVAMDDSLGEEKWQGLRNIVPTDEEVEVMNDTPSEQCQGQCEQFFKVVATIPNVTLRIDLFLYSIRFQSSLSDVLTPLQSFESFLRYLSPSSSLPLLLQHVLALGNYLNAATAKGGQYGFKIDTITKLKNTKSNSGKSLLHMLYHILSNNPKFLTQWNSDCEVISAVSRVEFQSLQGEISKLINTHKKLESEIEKQKKSNKDVLDQFVKKMSAFHTATQSSISDLSTRSASLPQQIKQVILFLGEDERKSNIDTLIGTFNTFVQDWKMVEKEVIEQKEREEKEKRMEADKQKRQKEQEERRLRNSITLSNNSRPAAASTSSSSGGADEVKVVESTLNTLNSSEAEILMAIQAKRQKAGEKINSQRTLTRRILPSLTREQGNMIANQLKQLKIQEAIQEEKEN